MTDSDVQKVCDALGVKPFEYDCDIFATPDICGYTPQSNDCSACGRATPVYPAGAVLLEALKAALIKRETMWGIEWMPNVEKPYYVDIRGGVGGPNSGEFADTELDALVAACEAAFCKKEGDK
jgi:hypothetical protein